MAGEKRLNKEAMQIRYLGSNFTKCLRRYCAGNFYEPLRIPGSALEHTGPYRLIGRLKEKF
jgi:hypothetical protein